jgi:PAS domain S-box-containing protein
MNRRAHPTHGPASQPPGFENFIYQEILKSTQEAFGVISEDGRILEVNDAYVAMSGYTRAELLSMSAVNLEADPTAPAFRSVIDTLRKTGSTRYSGMHKKKDGTLWRAEGVVRTMPAPVAGYFGFLRDVTQRVELEEELRLKAKKLEEQNAMKDRLFIILAHDLRGPVGNLTTLLHFIADQPMDTPDFRALLDEGRKSSSQTYNLLENLLGWVRSQIDEVVALRVRLVVFHTLVAIQDWLEPQAKAKRIRIRVDCPKRLTVLTDERMFETIVRNLVSNAIKFSPHGGLVILKGSTREGKIIAEVIDEGTGIPPEKVARLFQGQKVDSSLGTCGERGNGLGLMFCMDLARSLEGTLEVDSVVGEGSTFRLVLPDTVDEEL